MTRPRKEMMRPREGTMRPREEMMKPRKETMRPDLIWRRYCAFWSCSGVPERVRKRSDAPAGGTSITIFALDSVRMSLIAVPRRPMTTVCSWRRTKSSSVNNNQCYTDINNTSHTQLHTYLHTHIHMHTYTHAHTHTHTQRLRAKEREIEGCAFIITYRFRNADLDSTNINWVEAKLENREWEDCIDHLMKQEISDQWFHRALFLFQHYNDRQ